MLTLGSPASVIAAIREDAAAEAERIHDATETELASIREAADAMSVAIENRGERLSAARRERDERIARQEWEGRRAAIEQREAWIARVVAAAQERWPSIDPEKMNSLVHEAQARLPQGTCEVTARGVVVTAGHVSFDNRFEARARRLESEWRNALSRMYAP